MEEETRGGADEARREARLLLCVPSPFLFPLTFPRREGRGLVSPFLGVRGEEDSCLLSSA